MEVTSAVLLTPMCGAVAMGGTMVPHKPAECMGSPTSGTVKPWGWEWACPLPSASPRGPGSPGREEERHEGSKGGCQEAPGRSPPFLDSSTSACGHPT